MCVSLLGDTDGAAPSPLTYTAILEGRSTPPVSSLASVKQACLCHFVLTCDFPMTNNRHAGRITHKQLEEQLAPFKSGDGPAASKPYLPVLQTIAGSVSAMSAARVSRWNRLVAAEKDLLLGAMQEQTEDANVFGELLNLIPVPRLDGAPRNPRTNTDGDDGGGGGEWSVKEVLSFILLCYLLELSGPETKADEQQLQRALVHLLATEVADRTREEIQEDVASIFEEFSRLASVRTTCSVDAQLRGNASDPDQVYNPLIKQIADLVFDPARPDLSTLLHCHEPPKKGLISSGFGGLMGMMGRKIERPSDFATVLFVVVGGGITGNEVKDIHSAVQRHQTGVEVLVAGTNTLASAADVQEALRLGRFEE